ncbi:uncharacterized protein MONOS_10716 [Monocercomonoides exilis]|uniref:uncharacterized protein n=1 Tax=Monocercomonoides exilis TaxID=2049356 RepID=UPI00355A1FD7|nr:hypothetical protein MONOS_10716 [Monocercomonoides exilis]|eukprot:MONOS_10716.1-p1 / transcript=MONOS_10716.1 / gene=MONOS_10716 / organism=Monocercomonoides_exilis_PA203 / gene_product=unspecified product / transcript_product=unspecified product / location=Mono_scaffold00497:36210-36509(-) / protein_length=100 / sequence_SO=supercontig / SO=protein_coding / is_pseudo=false
MCFAVEQRTALHLGVECVSDFALSAMLSIPLVELLPLFSALVSTKSGSKLIFVEEDVNEIPSIFNRFGTSLLPSAIARLFLRSPRKRHAAVNLFDEVMR